VPASTKLQTSITRLSLALRALFRRNGTHIFLHPSGSLPRGLAVRWDGATLWNVSPGSPWCAGSRHFVRLERGRGICAARPLRVTGKVVEQGTRTRHPLQVLWWRKTHLHNPLDDADIPAEVGGMMRPRTRTQHRGIMGVIFCEPLAPLLHPGFLSVLSCGLTPGGRPEGVVAASRGASYGLASILRANEFSSSRKTNNLLFCSIVLQTLAPLGPLIRDAAFPHKNSAVSMSLPRLEETMTESRTANRRRTLPLSEGRFAAKRPLSPQKWRSPSSNRKKSFAEI